MQTAEYCYAWALFLSFVHVAQHTGFVFDMQGAIYAQNNSFAHRCLVLGLFLNCIGVFQRCIECISLCNLNVYQ